ncbi:MAG: cupin domain-containing protein [Bacteroidales bacterium]|nr:cupin domain-containing protein [Bacteroidales bacterium]
MMKVKKPSDKEIAEAKNWPVWVKGASNFPWYYDATEICYIVEGEVTVTDDSGRYIVCKAGDYVEFEKGLSCNWNITKAIKKHYTFL